MGILLNSIVAVAALSGGLEQSSVTDQERDLWTKSVRPYITQPTWDDGRNYTVGHTMMTPLHAAFLLKEKPWIDEFAEYVRRFVDVGMPQYTDWTTNGSARQRRIQYLYLLSRYMVLAAQTGNEGLIPRELPTFLSNAVDDIWNRGKMIAWEAAKFDSMKDCLQWKLDTANVRKSYFRAIVDEERFTQGVAADLKAYARITKTKIPHQSSIDDVINYATAVYKQRVSPTDGGKGWTFQPGVWEDHPDYAYSAVTDPDRTSSPNVKRGIAEDSSHSHRTALWLTSLRDAHEPGSEGYKYYQDLRDRLAYQFLNHVLVKPSDEFNGVRLNNYLDGSNGIYRWEYKNLGGANRGYRPYGLSFVFMLGWWTYLDHPEVRAAYAAQMATFPIKDRELMTYYAELTDDEKRDLLESPLKRATQRNQWMVSTMLASKIDLP